MHIIEKSLKDKKASNEKQQSPVYFLLQSHSPEATSFNLFWGWGERMSFCRLPLCV